MTELSISSLPLEVMYQILHKCSIPDVMALSIALTRPNLLDIFKQTKKWTHSAIGPMMMVKSLHFLGDHVTNLVIRGKLQFDKNCKPRKEKFFKSCELLPKHVLNYMRNNCLQIRVLTLDKCVLGPHINTSIFPKCLTMLVIRSTIFVKKSSFFSDIWSNLPNLKELRIENIQNFDKSDSYAVVSSLNIDFDIQFKNHEKSPSFIFYRN